ncbi:unnamed protein product [Brugia pahangi]|uniref:Ovule protein n=1 Tax=Brugia pahangi TaxID=6280 RepID=A0A0N4TYG9_BRUPA|nr:unnamed protein product [Brugia pahangi]
MCHTVPLDLFSCRLQKRRPSISMTSIVVGGFMLNSFRRFDLIMEASFFSFDFENPSNKQISYLESNDNKVSPPLNSKAVAFELVKASMNFNFESPSNKQISYLEPNDNKDSPPLNSKTVAFEIVKASMKLVNMKWF